MNDAVTDSGMPAYVPTSQTAVAVTGTIQVKPGREADVADLISHITPLVRAEEGCEEYSFHSIDGSPGTFVFYERWASGPDLVRHTQQQFMLEYFGKLPVLVEPTFTATYLRPLVG